jgi:ParB-like nuclease domain
MPREANTCLGCRVAAAAHRRRLDRVQRVPWPSRLAFRLPTPAAAFPKSVRSGLAQLYAGQSLAIGRNLLERDAGYAAQLQHQPAHDVEALADEPRIGALEGSGLAMPIARSRAAKRAATSQRSLSSMPASCALIAVSSVATRDGANTSPPSTRARARARGGSENQRPWPADKVERWSIDRLIPYAKNARTHSDAQIAAIAASIKEWGWTTPALVGEDGGLIAGHARVLAARQLGIAEIPVMVAAALVFLHIRTAIR